MEKFSLKERGQQAAVAYLERCGMKILEQDYPTAEGDIPIIAMDKDELVRVKVSVTGAARPSISPDPSTAIIRKYRKQMAQYVAATAPPDVETRVRFDEVFIRTLGDNKALLRHYRGAYGNE
jgi:Holliday junction resolvase-like predicted endonuclease